MTTIPVYKVDTAEGKLPKKAEVDRDQNIEQGFAYARDLPKDQQNYTYYAVTEDDDLQLFQIGDQVVAKEGTFLFMPVMCFCLSACRSRSNTYACLNFVHVVQESLAKPTLQFDDLKTCLEQKGVIKVKALAMLPPPTQVNPL